MLHFVNAYEDGDEIIVEGFYEEDPSPADNGMGDKWERAFRFLALDRMKSKLHRWHLNLTTGLVKEEPLSESITEFGMINSSYGGTKHRYSYSATSKTGWFLFNGLVKHDALLGTEQKYLFPDGVYGSETAMAPRVGSTGEDDGYLVTLISDVNADKSYCVVFDAKDITGGPICKLLLPERISSGTHSTWASGEDLPQWNNMDDPATAVGL